MGKKLDITDEIYGRLQAIVTDWYKTNLTGQTYWWCQCEDNNIVSVQLGALRNGSTQSCGCLQRELASEKHREDLTGQLFGRWRAVDINEEKSKETGHTYWNVICTKDGNKGCVRANNLKNGKSQSCGCLQKEIVSEIGSKKVGEKNHFWKGGITPLNMKIRISTKYIDFIQKILKKINYTCQLSGEKSKGDLQVHHIKPFAQILKENNITTEEQALNCKELWDENNVIGLKEKYHIGQKTDNPNAFHRIYGTVNFTEEDFYTWFNKFKIDSKKEITS